MAALGVLALQVPAAHAHAEELVVTITAEGVRPQVLVAEPGDTVRFVNEDRSFAYRAQSTGGPWRFDSGPTALLTEDFVVPAPVTRSGTHRFRVAQDPPYRGAVMVGGASPTAAVPSAPATAPPAPPPTAASPAPVPGASPAPAAVSGALPGPPSGRAMGLPTALAAVLVLGAGSLLLRLLLAEPVLSEGPATL